MVSLKSPQRFKSVSSIDPFEQLKNKYLASFDAKYLAIKKALDDHNHPVLLQLAHQLSGSAGSYGFDAISQAAWSVENTLHKTPVDAIELKRITQKLLQLIDQAKAA